LLVPEHSVTDSGARAGSVRKVDSRGPVRGDALVDRNADQLHLASAPQEVDQESCRCARVLAAAHADRDAFLAAEMDLGAELALRTSFDETQEVVATKMLPAVANPLDRSGGATVALHDESNRPPA